MVHDNETKTRNKLKKKEKEKKVPKTFFEMSADMKTIYTECPIKGWVWCLGWVIQRGQPLLVVLGLIPMGLIPTISLVILFNV